MQTVTGNPDDCSVSLACAGTAASAAIANIVVISTACSALTWISESGGKDYNGGVASNYKADRGMVLEGTGRELIESCQRGERESFRTV